MKGKETKGQRFFCKEDWNNAVIDLMSENGYSNVEQVYPKSNQIKTYHITSYPIVTIDYRMEPMPIFVQEWIKNHPQPTMNRDEFVHSLGERVSALEAALTEKGGLQ
ncbi:MAG: hypothetical protein BHV69_10160 [Bacteroidales bacterium 52_46]|nr:MAG: hypothetical protein BHV69_10160 [Bacteroidales bacterium 52_46]